MPDPGGAAGEVEAAVINQVRALLRAPEVIIRMWRAAWLNDEQIDERDVVEALQRLDSLWDQLFPAEQTRILQLLVARVKVRLDGLGISLRVEGIGSLVEELRLRAAWSSGRHDRSPAEPRWQHPHRVRPHDVAPARRAEGHRGPARF